MPSTKPEKKQSKHGTGGPLMSNFIFWLEHLSLEETYILFYFSIIALSLAFVPVAIWIDKKTGERRLDAQ